MVVVAGQNSVWQKTYSMDPLQQFEVNRVRNVYESAAGKGANVARCLGCFGVPAVLAAYTGGANGNKFTRACQDDGLDCRFTEIAAETRVCTTLLEDRGMTELVEPAPQISESERSHFKETLCSLLEKSEFLSIAGTAVRGEPEDCYSHFIKEAHKCSTPVLLDSYTEHGRQALAASPEILKINLTECEQLTGRPLATQPDKLSAYSELHRKYGIKWIVITKGPEGTEGFNGRSLIEVQPPKVQAVNPIGSGDSASAGLIYTLIGQRPVSWDDESLLADALCNATAFGTANCMNKKPGHIEKNDFEQVFRNLKKNVIIADGQ